MDYLKNGVETSGYSFGKYYFIIAYYNREDQK